MQDSLLSRFDLVFLVLDKNDDEFNRSISDHITRSYRYIPPGVVEGTPLTEKLMESLITSKPQDDTAKDSDVFEKFDELLHIGIRTNIQGLQNTRQDAKILSVLFLKKYIFYAKHRVNPVTTKVACEYIATTYAELREIVDSTKEKYRVSDTN